MSSGFTPPRPLTDLSLPTSSKKSSRVVQPPKSLPIDLPALQNASRVLQERFAKDATIIPDLGDMLTSPSGQVSASYSIFPDDLRVPFQKRKFIGIPDGLFQYYETTKVISHMGLMPEIERAWISIDHKLFLWDYIDGHEISSFVDQPDVITEVTLVNPKKGLFIDEISTLLVICTPITVLLIGVSFSSPLGGRQYQNIKLYATDLSVSTDVEMTSVVGTQDGRIFMCGAQDGNLYEFHYQENESWFGKRVQLVNHSVGGIQSLLPRFAAPSSEERIVLVVSDTRRNCIYTLTSKGSVSIYRPGSDKGVQHIQTLSNIYKMAQDRAPGYPALTPKNFQIISLHVVEESESRSGVQFFAMTSTGVRLYFAPSNVPRYSYNPSPTPSFTTRPVQLIHVRLPPSNLFHPDAHISLHRPSVTPYGASQMSSQPVPRFYVISSIENTCYAQGLTIAAQQGNTEGTDYILCMAPDLTRIGTLGQLNIPSQKSSVSLPPESYHSTLGDGRPPLTEHATLLAIPGRTWAMATMHRVSYALAPSDGAAPTALNELATQFGEYPHQLMLLTNVGLTFLAKRRALDYLKAVLEELQSEGNVQPIIEFRDSFGRDQTCCMLLGLASGNTFLDTPDGSPTGTISMLNPDIAAVAKQAFYDFGERPMWAERITYGTTDNKGTAIFSGRREGLALYFSRLVRPFWKSKLTKPGILNRQKLAVTEIMLVTIQKNLYALKDFLDKNPHLFHSYPSESSTRVPVTEQEAWKAERNSVSELLSLLSRTIEALSFILLLSDHMFGDLVSQCDLETQKLIASQTFEDLITTQDGMAISRALVNVIIDQQIGQQISVDTISEILQLRCGSFCSTDDVMLYKAKENIRKAVETRNPVERQNCLAESLRLFIKGARILEFDKLREVCGDYQQLSYSKGAVELPLTCAQIIDPDNIGLDSWKIGLPASDPRSQMAEQRLRCYDLVMDSLTVFQDKHASTRTVGSDGNNDPEAVRNHAYELAFSSEDEMFHSTLYDWLIGRGLADDLLEMRPPFLEAHLKREPVSVQKFVLLWQFYVKNGQPLRAAEVLAALAESTQFEIDLDARLEYLTLAVANAKSHPISVTGRHETAIAFLTDLEEKLEVAQVQLEIYNTLIPNIDDAPEVGDRIKLLSKQFFTMTDLYQRYAVAFDLPDVKLLCLHVSEHRDESVVRPIWNQIFDESTPLNAHAPTVTLKDNIQVLKAGADPSETADLIISRLVPLGKRFFPSESAFPLRFIATLLVRFTLANRNVVPHGWAPRILVQCGVPFTDIWDVFHEMYESQIPPFNDQANVQAISSDIAVLLSDWLEDAKRPQSFVGREEFPVGRIDQALDQYLAELEGSRSETKASYENVKRQLRQNW